MDSLDYLPSPVGFAKHRIILNEEGRPEDFEFLEANPAFMRHLGLETDRLIGRRAGELVAGLTGLPAVMIARYGKLALSRGKGTCEVCGTDEGFRCKIYVFPVEQGFFCVNTVDTTTEWLEVQMARTEGREQHQLIFEHAAEGMFVVQDNAIQTANPRASQISGYSPEEMRQMAVSDFCRDERKESEGDWITRRLAEPVTEKECLFTRKNGEKIWVRVSSMPVQWNGKPAVQFFMLEITDVKKAEHALWTSEEKHRTITELVSDVIWVFNYSRRRLVFLSSAVQRMTGFTVDEYIGLSMEEIYAPESQRTIGEQLPESVAEFLADPQESYTVTAELQQICKGGGFVWTEVSATFRLSECGEVEIYGISRNIEERKRSEAQVLYLSFRDQLTGLYNRRFYDEELQRLDARRNLPLTLVQADVNGLKLINDAFGHKAGDELLISVAQILKRECRKDDIIARVGGDEFILLLPGTGPLEADKLVTRLRRAIGAERHQHLVLSVSFGWATKVAEDQTMDQIYTEAENRMYRRKLSEGSSMRSETFRTITQSLFRKLPDEEKHATQVSELCGAIGQAMGLKEDDLGELMAAGLLHDIGKIGLDTSLLEKPAALTKQETAKLRQHSETGYQILRSSNEFMNLSIYILCHHERMDGGGYPRGLKGEDIPLPARIISVADAYVAMTSIRPYRAALTREEAVAEIVRHAGTQFDAAVARVLVEKVLNEPWTGQSGG